MCEQQIQRGVGGNESVEVRHLLAIPPEERTRVPAPVEGHTNHLASVVNTQASTVDISRKRAEVLHTRLPGPQEGVKVCVAFQIRSSNYLTLVIELPGY